MAILLPTGRHPQGKWGRVYAGRAVEALRRLVLSGGILACAWLPIARPAHGQSGNVFLDGLGPSPTPSPAAPNVFLDAFGPEAGTGNQPASGRSEALAPQEGSPKEVIDVFTRQLPPAPRGSAEEAPEIEIPDLPDRPISETVRLFLPSVNAEALAGGRANGEVLVTKALLRCLSGPLTTQEEEALDRRWAAAAANPSPKLKAHLKRANPLLLDILAAREGATWAAREYDFALYDRLIAQNLADEEARLAAEIYLQFQIDMMRAAARQAEAATAELEALGPEPDPGAEVAETVASHEAFSRMLSDWVGRLEKPGAVGAAGSGAAAWVYVADETPPPRLRGNEGAVIRASDISVGPSVATGKQDYDYVGQKSRYQGTANWEPFPERLAPGRSYSNQVKATARGEGANPSCGFGVYIGAFVIDAGGNLRPADNVRVGADTRDGAAATSEQAVAFTIPQGGPGQKLMLQAHFHGEAGEGWFKRYYEYREAKAPPVEPPPADDTDYAALLAQLGGGRNKKTRCASISP